ncbi:MAG TPA: superoxide dismutase, partial [Synechococcales bacterium UBA10510]|nr:superoxide dismutase [Synechococcales bacterium UBA10510]
MPFPLFTRFLLAGLTALCLLLGSALPAWAEFSLPPLPYAVDALEPAIDATTMTIHHDRHHGAYVANLNGQIQANPSLADLNLNDLQAKISQFPVAVRNNGGGHWNHSLFWTLLAPAGQGGSPSQDLIAAIDRDFGSMQAMRTQFEQAATTRFGSGWAWLIRKPDGSLAITST